jgi:uncharacterized protein
MSWQKIVISFLLVGTGFISVGMVLAYCKLKKVSGRPCSSGYTIKKRTGTAFLQAQKDQGGYISFKTEDGLLLSGFIVIRPYASRLIVVCHGFWQAKEFLYEFAHLFPHDNLLFFDLRAHGTSQGDALSFGYHESKDVKAALKYIQEDARLNSLPVYGIGLCMGGVSILKALEEGAAFDGIVIDSAFACLYCQMCRSFQLFTKIPSFIFFLLKPLIEYQAKFCIKDVNPVQYIEKVKIPVLLIHANDDRIVPVEDAYILYDTIQARKKLWITEKTGHLGTYKIHTHKYREIFDDFFGSPNRN